MSHSTFLILSALAAWLICAVIFGGRLPKPFRARSCQGKEWRKAFPSTSKQQIREFLSNFVSAFAYNEDQKLKFQPNDRLLSIYKAEYRHPWQADGLEFETLAQDFEKQYGLNLESVWRDELTLGELLSYALAARQMSIRNL